MASFLSTLTFGRFGRRAPVVAVLRLAGVIGARGPFGAAINMAGMAELIQRAFAMRGLKAVALSINSPGGTPVQAGLIQKRIRQLAVEKDVPVIAFCEDVAASGGYWLACAADEIYADENSIVGSIGVITSGFGFAEAIAKLGIERRIYRQGDRKTLLDPFQPVDAADVARLGRVQREVHESFQELVRSRRGARLKAAESELFSGEFWTGARALELGLIDGIGEVRGVMRDRLGERVQLRAVAPSRRWLRRKLGLGGAAPEEWAGGVMAAVESRALWSRYGL